MLDLSPYIVYYNTTGRRPNISYHRYMAYIDYTLCYFFRFLCSFFHVCILHLCCSAHQMFLNMHSIRQLEPPLPLNFSYKIFGHSALAPNFSFDPIFCKGDTGSLVHSRECGEATAVSVTFHPHHVAGIGKCGSRRLNLRFLVL